MYKLLTMIDIQKGFNCKEVDCIVNKFNSNHRKFDHIYFCMFENRKGSLFEKKAKVVIFSKPAL